MTTASQEQLRAEFNRLPYPVTACGCDMCREDEFRAFVARRLEAAPAAADAATLGAAYSLLGADYSQLAPLSPLGITSFIVDETTDFASLPSLNARQIQTDTAPLPGGIMSERAKIQAKLDKYFHKLIPDNEIEDRGSYLLWTGFTGAQTFAPTPDAIASTYQSIRSLKDYGYSEKSLRASKAAAPWVYPSNKPVRVEGWFRSPGPLDEDDDVIEFRRFIASELQQWYVRGAYGDVDSDYFYNSSIVSWNMEAIPCRLTDVPPATRLSMIAKIARVRCSAGLISVAQRNRVIGIADARRQALYSQASPTPASEMLWRGRPMPEFASHRADLAELGEMLRCPDDHSASAFVDLLTRLRLQNYRYSAAVQRWNEIESLNDGVQIASCGHLTANNDAVDVHDNGRDVQVCETCSDAYFVDVTDTHDRRRENTVFWHDDGDYRTYSPEADPDDDDDEDRDDENRRVQNYSTNVLDSLSADSSIMPSTFGDFLMGVELEVVPRNGWRDQTIQRTGDELCDGYAIMKHDGSLQTGGFEIVTAPRGLREHIDRFTAWKPHPALRAWDVGCCGLHVHISSQAFSQATLGKFIEFINSKANVTLIRAIAGRHATVDSQAQHYCKVDGMAPGNPKKTLADKSPDRYYMVNTCNMDKFEIKRLGLTRQRPGKSINTVELRIFRASLKKERLLAQIEFAHAAVMFCRATSMRDLGQPAFLAWLQKSAGLYPNLAKWFGVKANTMTIVEAPPAQALAEV